MRARAIWFVLPIVLFPASVRAHDHNADFFFAACYADGSSLGGIDLSGAKTLRFRQLSVVGDFGLKFGSHDDRDLRLTTFTGGLRWMIAKPETKHVPFVQVLVGGGHAKSEGSGDTDAAIAIGGGYEFAPEHIGKTTFGFRVFTDAIRNNDEWFQRFSVGAVIRLYHK